MTKASIRGALGTAIGVVLIAGQVYAAPILWTGSSLSGDGTTDISVLGSLVEAHNTGTGVAITAGGVLFDGAEPNPLGSVFTGADTTGLTGDANFDSLLNTASYSVAGPINYIIDGLTNGRSYLAQFFVTDTRTCCSLRTVTLNDGGANSLTSGPLGAGFAFTGTFIAAGNETIVFSGFAADQPAGGQNVPYLNAWQLRDVTPTQQVPEPGTLLLLALGLMAITVATRGLKLRS